MEIQQSPLYAKYTATLRWVVIKIDGSYVYIKKFPLLGGFAKLQRITKLPNHKNLLALLSKNNVKRLVVEPDSQVNQAKFSRWCDYLSKYVTVLSSPYLATKTRVIDLQQTEKNIFNNFSEAKRRAVRRALKNKLRIYESTNINEFIQLKNRSAGFLGFITTTGIKPLWLAFAPKYATILMDENKTAGILLLFWDQTAYYWLAAATKNSKKLFTPTLLVWQALKLAKKKRYKRFDFVGVWDERRPNANKSWKGFTKFKEGFGGNSLYYPIS